MNRLSTFLLAVLLATPALADPPSFTFAQAGYQRMDVRSGTGSSIDADGWGVGGSFEVGEIMFLIASYARGDMDPGVDLEEIQAGIGLHLNFNDNSAFFATLSYVEADASIDSVDVASEDGYGVSIGIRSNASELVEIALVGSYVDLGSGSDTTSVGTEVIFNVTDHFAVGADISYDDDVTSYGASARFYFGS